MYKSIKYKIKNIYNRGENLLNKQEFIRKYKMEELSESNGLAIDIIYATSNNFTKQVLYLEPICMLRAGTAKKLLNANKEFNNLGFKIKIWDAFRPIIFQKKMWNIFPDERFVANPEKGNSNHCKGSAVDITLYTLDNKEIKMPTEFDHFGIESYRNYYDKLDEETRNNVLLLENVMVKNGFDPFAYEWWHFNDIDDYGIIYEYFK